MTFLQTLSQRDKKTLLIGISIAAILVIALAWQMLDARLTSSQQTAQKTHELLQWIKQADTQLSGQATEKTEASSNNPLPTVIQSALNDAGMSSHIARLHQNEKGAVDLSLTAVDFDKLITVLTHIQHSSGATPVQIHITRVTDKGGVNTEMVLQK